MNLCWARLPPFARCSSGGPNRGRQRAIASPGGAGGTADQARKHEIDVSTQGRGHSPLAPDALGGGSGGSPGVFRLDIALSEPFVIMLDEHRWPVGKRQPRSKVVRTCGAFDT